jgi:hypothetical protein
LIVAGGALGLLAGYLQLVISDWRERHKANKGKADGFAGGPP